MSFEHEPDAIRKLSRLGLLSVLEEAQDLLFEARRKVGVNDIVICAFCREEAGEGVARIYGAMREKTRALLMKEVPDAVKTIAKLADPCPVDRFLLLVQFEGDLWILELDAPKGSTAGTFN